MECVKDKELGANGREKTVRRWQSTEKEIMGVPIVDKYKYLGTYLDFKLREESQVNHTRQKSNWIYIKLYPYLVNASADGRRDMWQTMVAPLFNGLLALMGEEKSVANLSQVFTIWYGSFK